MFMAWPIECARPSQRSLEKLIENVQMLQSCGKLIKKICLFIVLLSMLVSLDLTRDIKHIVTDPKLCSIVAFQLEQSIFFFFFLAVVVRRRE